MPPASDGLAYKFEQVQEGNEAYQIVDRSKAIASQRQLVSHGTHSIFAPEDLVIVRPSNHNVGVHSHIERVFPGVWMLGRTIRDHHLGKGQAVEDRTDCAIVVVCDR